jgi:hypothetical protein
MAADLQEEAFGNLIKAEFSSREPDREAERTGKFLFPDRADEKRRFGDGRGLFTVRAGGNKVVEHM